MRQTKLAASANELKARNNQSETYDQRRLRENSRKDMLKKRSTITRVKQPDMSPNRYGRSNFIEMLPGTHTAGIQQNPSGGFPGRPTPVARPARTAARGLLRLWSPGGPCAALVSATRARAH
ncbi:hypothetical protein MRX96_041563 [Rhipicephalus microplus]